MPATHLSIRDTLFGDMPMELFPPQNLKPPHAEPFASFIAARECIAAGDIKGAIDHWIKITLMPQQETRVYLQAWNFLRTHGVPPPPQVAKIIMGVVIEVALPGGLDLLAAYPDHHARYYNYSGAGVVWEHPNDSLDPFIDDLISKSNTVLQRIGPWDKPRLGPPTGDTIRLNFLAPSGLHFGQGPLGVMSREPMAKPVIDSAVVLMQQLMALSTKK